MSKHYEERYYTREEIADDCDDYHHRSSSRRRSTSRPRGHHMQPPPEEQYYRHRLARSGSGTSISSMSDCEYRTQCSDRPMVRVPREVCRAPTPPPVIQRVVERAPTPEPDVVERVIVRPQPQQLIERIIERPRTPPPRIINKEICEPAPPPIVRTRIVKVDPSPRHYINNCESISYMCQPAPQSSARSTAGMYTYAPQAASASADFDYGYDNSYSNSYSTTELLGSGAGSSSCGSQIGPTSGYKYVSTAPAAMSSAMYTQIPTGAGASSAAFYPATSVTLLQPQQPMMQQPASSFGYSYGYKPNCVQQQGYMPNPMMNRQQY